VSKATNAFVVTRATASISFRVREDGGCCFSLSDYRSDLGAAVVVGLPQLSRLVSEKTDAAVVP